MHSSYNNDYVPRHRYQGAWYIQRVVRNYLFWGINHHNRVVVGKNRQKTGKLGMDYERPGLTYPGLQLLSQK